MTRKSFLTTVMTAMLFFILISLQAVSAADSTKIYRLYNSVNGEHLYTTSAEEVKQLTTSHGWKDEGIGWNAPNNGDAVYRLYNAGLANHLYTTDTNEVNELTTKHGWTKDFEGKPLFYSGGSTNIYRLYDAKSGLHHLTTDVNEYNTLPAHGWVQEGVALKGISGASNNTTTPSTPSQPSTPAPSASDISNVASEYSIEADVELSGSGSGYHAKLVACTATSAVSFGIQFDSAGEGEYNNQTAFLIENVEHNNANGQTYTRTGLSSLNQKHHLMLTVQKDGTCDVYVNGAKAGSVHNSGLANQTVYLRVEGSARLNGDSVNAKFSNIKLKGHGTYYPDKVWGTHNFDTNATIHSTDNYTGSKSVSVSGTVSGLAAGQDWDSAYDKVSGILQFVE